MDRALGRNLRVEGLKRWHHCCLRLSDILLLSPESFSTYFIEAHMDELIAAFRYNYSEDDEVLKIANYGGNIRTWSTKMDVRKV